MHWYVCSQYSIQLLNMIKARSLSSRQVLERWSARGNTIPNRTPRDLYLRIHPHESNGDLLLSWTLRACFCGCEFTMLPSSMTSCLSVKGQRGPLWIRPAKWRQRPYELISSKKEDIEAMMTAESNAHHLMVSDWNYQGMDILTVMYRDTGATPSCAASIVTNGKGRTMCLDAKTLASYDQHGQRDSMGCLPPVVGAEFINEMVCKETSTDFEVIQADEGEKYLWLNFIHPGAHHELRISIDEHDMHIVAADGDFVHPKKVQASTDRHLHNLLRLT